MYGRRCCAVDRQPDGSPLLRTSQECAGPELPCPVLLRPPERPAGPLTPARVRGTPTAGCAPTSTATRAAATATRASRTAPHRARRQVWRRDEPNNHNFNGWPHNYCRQQSNGGYEHGPWCYVAPGTDRHWESRAVPRCPTLGDPSDFALHGAVPFRSDRARSRWSSRGRGAHRGGAPGLAPRAPQGRGGRAGLVRGAWRELASLHHDSGSARPPTRCQRQSGHREGAAGLQGPLRWLHGQDPPEEPWSCPSADRAQVAPDASGTVDSGAHAVFAVLARAGGAPPSGSTDGQRFSPLHRGRERHPADAEGSREGAGCAASRTPPWTPPSGAAAEPSGTAAG